MASALFPWQRVRVSGPSMVPTLRDGDVVFVRHGARVASGDIVLATFRSMPDRLVLKRAQRPQDGGWWLVSDNAAAGGDSTVHGVADVQARVTWLVRSWRVRPLTRRSGPSIASRMGSVRRRGVDRDTGRRVGDP